MSLASNQRRAAERAAARRAAEGSRLKALRARVAAGGLRQLESLAVCFCLSLSKRLRQVVTSSVVADIANMSGVRDFQTLRSWFSWRFLRQHESVAWPDTVLGRPGELNSRFSPLAIVLCSKREVEVFDIVQLVGLMVEFVRRLLYAGASRSV